MSIETKLDWRETNPETLPAEVAKAYVTYKSQYAIAKKAREAFEQAALKASELPATHRLVFSYNFGRLSIAIDKAKAASTSSKAVSFASLKV